MIDVFSQLQGQVRSGQVRSHHHKPCQHGIMILIEMGGHSLEGPTEVMQAMIGHDAIMSDFNLWLVPMLTRR